jgi:glycolate oxidase
MGNPLSAPAGTAANALVDALREILPADAVVVEREALRPFESDGLMLYRALPLVAVLPESADQVQAVIRCCAERNVPVVARGSGTGVCGGAMPHPEGVLLNLARLDRILAIDPLARTATVEPGVTNLRISETVAEHGLYYAPDPSSQIACSIGGNVAENSGGVHCLKYGLTVHNLLSVDIITADGERVTLGNHSLDSPGYDLMALITGSEGLLGVVVSVTVQLLPTPPEARVVLAGFDSVRAAGDAVGALIADGIVPAGLEMMDSLAITAAEDFARAGYPRDAAALLLCEVDGTHEEVDTHSDRVCDLFRKAGATSVRVSHDEAERALLWKGRKSAFPAVGRLAPDYYCMDGTIPRGRISEVLEEISRLSAHYDLPVANVFHAGDGNLHPLILYDAGNPDAVARAEHFGADILELSVRVGGAITGEHGVGVEKLAQMKAQFSEPELLQMEDIKAAFDPGLILNPGKGIPILKRCQEYRALPPRQGHVG